jgi:hypothetical protein
VIWEELVQAEWEYAKGRQAQWDAAPHDSRATNPFDAMVQHPERYVPLWVI